MYFFSRRLKIIHRTVCGGCSSNTGNVIPPPKPVAKTIPMQFRMDGGGILGITKKRPPGPVELPMCIQTFAGQARYRRCREPNSAERRMLKQVTK